MCVLCPRGCSYFRNAASSAEPVSLRFSGRRSCQNGSCVRITRSWRSCTSWAHDGIRTLERRSNVLGFAPSLLCVVAWVGCGAAVARAGVGALWHYPGLAQVFVMVAAAVVGIGGLVGFWIISSHIDFWRRGYRARWLTGNEWVYEERRAEGTAQCLAFSREIVGHGYPAPWKCTFRMRRVGNGKFLNGPN